MVDLVKMLTVEEWCIEKGLSSRLAHKQHLIVDDVLLIASLHDQRKELFEQAEAEDPNTSTGLTTLHRLVEVLRQLEFKMQRAWKFDEIESMHSWWYRMPHCECPVLDNDDPMFGDIISPHCTLHGNKLPVTIDG